VYLLIRAAYAFFGLLSFTAIQKAGSITGSIMYYLLPSRRKIALRNCEVIGVENPVQTVKESFRHTFMSYFESFYAPRIDADFLEKYVEVEYLEGMPEDRGYFMVSAHFGAWELSSFLMTAGLGLKGAAVARKIKNQKIDDFIVRQRKNSDVEYIHHRNATEIIKQFMDKNLSVGVLLDHSSMPKDSMVSALFGIKTTFIKGIPLLAVRKNYPVLPVFIVRKKVGFKMIVYPVIWPDKNLKPKERAQDIADRINGVFEDIISKHPEQWYLIHKRFKRIADKEGNIVTGIYQ